MVSYRQRDGLCQRLDEFQRPGDLIRVWGSQHQGLDESHKSGGRYQDVIHERLCQSRCCHCQSPLKQFLHIAQERSRISCVLAEKV